MSKSKNNSSAVITFYERQNLKQYGTQSVRLGKESQQAFDQCNICLNAFNEPLACPKGHLFCKACIYEALLVEFKQHKKELKDWKETRRLLQNQEREGRDREQLAKIDSFMRQESYTPPIDTDINNSDEGKGSGSGGWVRKVKNNTDHLTTPYWLPEQAPKVAPFPNDSSNSMPSNYNPSWQVPRPKLDTHCPRGGHLLRASELTALEFTIFNDHRKTNRHDLILQSDRLKEIQPGSDQIMVGHNNKEMADESKPIVQINQSHRQSCTNSKPCYMCFMCSKNLATISKVILIKSCGHVLCYKCCENFVTRSKTKICPFCSMPCHESDQLILLQPPGSAFSSGGATIIKKDTPAARLM